MLISAVKEIKALYDIDQINFFLKDGWILLHITTFFSPSDNCEVTVGIIGKLT